jgi:hypothetical protein
VFAKPRPNDGVCQESHGTGKFGKHPTIKVNILIIIMVWLFAKHLDAFGRHPQLAKSVCQFANVNPPKQGFQES